MRWRAITPKIPPAAGGDADALRDALPSSAELREFLSAAAQASEPILLLVNDSHRATHTRAALEILLQLAESQAFHAIVATGTHQFGADEKLAFERLTFSGHIHRGQPVIWHNAANAIDDVELAGVRMNRAIAEHRFLLPIGSIEPHYFAGLTGAHKTVTIGVMARADIERNHAGALDPASDVLRLDGNPVHDGIVRILHGLQRAGKRVCAINQVAGGRRLLAAAAGDPLETLHALSPLARKIYVETVASPVDVLQLRVPMPLGRSFYQADKALKNNHRAVRDGGGIILEADCPEGIGPNHFMGLLGRAASYATARAIVETEGYNLGDHKAVKLRHLTDPAERSVRIALVSTHVSEKDAALAGMRTFPTVAAALGWLGDELGDRCREGLIVEDAGNATVSAEA